MGWRAVLQLDAGGLRAVAERLGVTAEKANKKLRETQAVPSSEPCPPFPPPDESPMDSGVTSSEQRYSYLTTKRNMIFAWPKDHAYMKRQENSRVAMFGGVARFPNTAGHGGWHWSKGSKAVWQTQLRIRAKGVIVESPKLQERER